LALFLRVVMSGHRSVYHAAGCEQPALAVGLHDERVVAVEVCGTAVGLVRPRRRGTVDGEVGHVLARPLPGVLIPPDELLAFGPRGAVGGRRGAVIQDAAVGRPRPRPFGSGL